MTKDDDIKALGKSSKKSSLFKKSVDITKVNLPIIKTWMETTIQEELPDDDIVVEFIFEMLQAEDQPDIKAIREQMDDFIGKDESLKFCEELWSLLLSGQNDPDGIPEQLLEQRKRQLEKETAEKAKIMISQMRLKPDYSRSRPSYNRRDRSLYQNGKGTHDRQTSHHNNRRHRSEYPSENPRENLRQNTRVTFKSDARDRSPVRSQSGSKTNYNRAKGEERGDHTRGHENGQRRKFEGSRNVYEDDGRDRSRLPSRSY